MNSKNGMRITLSIHQSKSKPNLERVSTVWVPLGNWIFNPPLHHIQQQQLLRHSFGKRRKRARCDCHTSAYPVVLYVRKCSSSMFPSIRQVFVQVIAQLYIIQQLMNTAVMQLKLGYINGHFSFLSGKRLRQPNHFEATVVISLVLMFPSSLPSSLITLLSVRLRLFFLELNSIQLILNTSVHLRVQIDCIVDCIYLFTCACVRIYSEER